MYIENVIKKRQKKKIRRQVFLTLTGGLIVLAIPLLAYFSVFYSTNFSNNIDYWSGFGEFLNGTAGTVFTFANIVVFVWLSIKLSNVTNDYERKNIMLQKTSLMTQFRTEAIGKIEKELMVIDFMSSDFSDGDLERILKTIEELSLQYFHFFNDIENEKCKEAKERSIFEFGLASLKAYIIAKDIFFDGYERLRWIKEMKSQKDKYIKDLKIDTVNRIKV